MLIYALCRQLSRVEFTHFLWSNPPECQDWGAGGGQANLGNARIFTAFVAATPPLEVVQTISGVKRVQSRDVGMIYDMIIVLFVCLLHAL